MIPRMMKWGTENVRLGLALNQWLVGIMYDEGRLVPERWLVFHVGPVSLSVAFGRVKP